MRPRGCAVAVVEEAGGSADEPASARGRVSDAIFGHLEIGAQVLDADRRGLLDPQVFGLEGTEHHDPTARAGDGDVEAPLAPSAVKRPEVER